MIKRFLYKLLKIIIFICWGLYVVFIIAKMIDAENNFPFFNNILAFIAALPIISGKVKLGNLVILVVGGLILSGAFDD